MQARVRGTTLMALSNSEGHLVLATGNKSELAVGYSTIYGDAVGGFAPLKDVPKTLVWALARWRNAQRRGARRDARRSRRTRSRSHRRRSCGPGQLDSDSLPDYDELDAILARYVDGDRSVAEIVADGFDADAGRPGRAPGRRGRVEAPPVPAGPEDQFQGVRPGPPAADHEPVARARTQPM